VARVNSTVRSEEEEKNGNKYKYKNYKTVKKIIQTNNNYYNTSYYHSTQINVWAPVIEGTPPQEDIEVMMAPFTEQEKNNERNKEHWYCLS